MCDDLDVLSARPAWHLLFEEKSAENFDDVILTQMGCSADKLIVIDAIFTSSTKLFLAVNAHATTVVARINLSFLGKVIAIWVWISDFGASATDIVLNLVLVLVAAALSAATASKHADYVEL